MESKTSTELFTEKSEAYAKYRPGYPEEALDIILEPFKSQKSISIADIGAGTGIASRLLADLGASVNAIEPNASMIESADSHPNITYHKSNAEDIPLVNNSADIVTSFQSFHWFNFKKSLKEFRRILKPSGRLSLVWSYWDTKDPFTSAYAEIIGDATVKNPNRTEPYAGLAGKLKELRVRLLWKLKYLPFYKNVKRHNFKLVNKVDLQDLIGCAKSQSYILHEGEAWDELVQDIKQLYVADKEAAKLAYDINVFTAEPR